MRKRFVMKKNTAINIIKLLVLSDLMIQISDEVLSEKSELKTKLDEINKYLEPVVDSMYNHQDFRRTTIVQELQHKIDSLFRHTFKELEIKN